MFLLASLAVGLDMWIGGSVYHPLTYLYGGGSWFFCQGSDACSARSAARTVQGNHGMVVTEQQEASRVGVEVLQAGGNAIDAAVAVGYTLAVTYPCCGNLGGGGFMLIQRADGSSTAINFRERASQRATASMYLDRRGKVRQGLSKDGYLAVGVPGTVAGLERARSRYGTMSRQRLIAPAIRLAAGGFVLGAGDVAILEAATSKLSRQPNVAAILLKNGKPYRVGDRLVQRDLAQTLRQVAHGGEAVFYRGRISAEVVRASDAQGGILTLEDFESYSVTESQPLQCRYRGRVVLTVPPPGGGVTLCQMLTILDGYSLDPAQFRSADSLHYFLSAMVFSYADRNRYLGDPKFVSNPVQKLLSPRYAAQVRQQIGAKAVSPQHLYFRQEGEHTTHYSVVDRFGNAVAVTYTINSPFGAKVIAGRTGFLLNNEMDDFASKPGEANQFGLVQGEANAIQPGKRPLSSMAPTMVLQDGKLWLVTGSSGGSTISTTIVQVISNVVDYGMAIEQAVAAPHIHFQGLPNVVVTEPFALDSKTVQLLWGKGYHPLPFRSWGAAESILVEQRSGVTVFYGVNDPRKPGGRAVGY